MSFFEQESAPAVRKEALAGCARNDIGSLTSQRKSPYELFKKNVAVHCNRVMYGSFEPSDCDQAERSVRELKKNCCRLQKLKSRLQARERISNPSLNHSKPSCFRYGGKSRGCSCSNLQQYSDLGSERILLRSPSTAVQTANKWLTQPNVVLESKSNKTLSHSEPCECQVHSKKHKNCCNCSEPYHRNVCDCSQHGKTHAYCCRCDSEMLKNYDIYLKKKKYLNIPSSERDSFVGASSGISRESSAAGAPQCNPCSISKGQFARTSDKERRLFPWLIPQQLKNCGPTEAPSTDFKASSSKLVCLECSSRLQTTENTPCSICCENLNSIYDVAIQEVYNMLVEISRTLEPSTHCCSLENLIKELKDQCRSKVENEKHLCSSCIELSTESLTELIPELEEPLDCKEKRNNKPATEIQRGTIDEAVQVNLIESVPEESQQNETTTQKRWVKNKLKNYCSIS